MAHYVIKKWIEPYVLLETLKSKYTMKDFTFDGFSKNALKKEFLKELQNPETFGLYMKNVNKFYLFTGVKDLNLDSVFGFSLEDYDITEDFEVPLSMVDSGKAEAGIILF